MATLLNTNIRGEQIANTTISGIHIVNASISPVKTDVYNSPTDGDVLTYKSSTSQFEWNSIGTMVVNEVPTGSINGANTTFTLSDTPVGNTLEVNLNGILQEPGSGNDYTISTDTITFTSPPETGDIILCSYLISAGLGGGVYTDHGNLDGLGDDDHLQYIKVDGSRAFTGVIAGITPTIAAHLSTKGYVDGEIGSHAHDTSDITTGTFADARIAQSNVTQHEAAINHNNLLNTHNLTTSIDHGQIGGLGDDDHTIYSLADGTRAFTAVVGGIDPTADAHLATKKYVDDSVLQTASNVDVDTGTETVDTFADTAGDGCVWSFVVKNGTNLRTGEIMSCWDSSGNVEYTESSTNSLGNTAGLTLAVDINSNNVRLRATASSDNWSVKVIRMLM
jgi:hypothetical protein